jgi:hypothetical protein
MFSARQVVVGTAGTTLLANLPEGPCNVTLSNTNPSTLYVGPGTGVSSMSGFPVPATTPAFTISFPPMAAPLALYARVGSI